MRKTALMLLVSLGISTLAHAGSTGSASLHMPQGSGAGTANGDYVTASAVPGLNTFYRYFIEVTPNLSRLQVELFDADVGFGGSGEASPGRDRARGGGFDTTATYSLIDPSGAARTLQFTTGNTLGPADNAWVSLYNTTGDSVRDNFGTNAYTNNDGTDNWASDWVETDGGGGGATGGAIRVIGGELRLQDGVVGTPDIYREANLVGMSLTTATLTFDYRTSNTLDASDDVLVQISNNGGGSYTTLETFTNDSAGARSYPITAFIATNTRVRFLLNGLSTSDEFFFVDNLQITDDGAPLAGHWELRVAQSAGGDDINALGIRAHDGTSAAGGTELNVYADSMVSLGVNPDPGPNSRSYTLYPWITSGCECSQNDFDRDTNSGDTGSGTYTSRSGGFTQTFLSPTLSLDNAWNHDNLTRWGDDDESDDYGIWTWSPTINTYGVTNGNYETTYVGSYLTAGDPTTNPVVSGGNPAAFRIYLPTDAGVAPVKPYLEQFLTQNRSFPGPNPAQVGVQTVYTVTVRLVNPTVFPVTYSTPTNIVTANIPGGGTTYDSFNSVSQGAIVTQPAAGGTGNITWNPGTLAAGATALMAYNIRITPPSAARVLATATPASGNGTRARFVDETGNTTQTRATYLMGGVCELAVTASLATEVLLSSFQVDVRGGAASIEWSTASEAGTIGFNIYRADNGAQVNTSLIPASMKSHGGKYRLLDRNNADPNLAYYVEEVTAGGARKHYGPLNRLVGVDRDHLRAGGGPRLKMASNASWKLDTNAPRGRVVAAMAGVRNTGVVRISAVDLAAILGEKDHTVTKALADGRLAVTHNGATVSWTTDGASLQFFGEASTSIYSFERVYRVELATGSPMQRAQWGSANVPVTSFLASQEIETDAFGSAVLPLNPAGDYFFWDYVVSGDATNGNRIFKANVPSMASASGATLSVRLQGALKNAQHGARITLNGVVLGNLSWSSLDAHDATLSVPAAVLRDGPNEIGVAGILAGGAPYDVFYVDGFTLKYMKFAKPEAGQIEVRSGATVAAGPFTTSPLILDISTRNRPVVVQGASFQNGTAAVTSPANRTLFLTESFLAPSSLRGTPEAQLRGRLRADWLIIAPRSMRTAATSLAQLREREGLTTMVADLEQVYDEFAGGNVTPLAIRDFLRSTRSWSVAPRYVVLAGNGNFDYRGIVTAAAPMPPIMTSTPDGLFAADSLFTDFNGDGLPEVAIGRIPVDSAEELARYVAKLEANVRVAASSAPMVFSADAADNGASFRDESQQAEAPLSGRPIRRVYVDELGGTGARNALLGAWQAGTPLVSWVGHGGLDQISNSGVLTSYDMGALRSTGRLPVFVAMTCTINRFENGYVAPLGVALTREEGAGAVAVWSASGLSQHEHAAELQRTFMRLASQASATTRLGDLIVSALASHKGDTSSIYLLLGDPAIRLDLPMEATNAGNHVNSGE